MLRFQKQLTAARIAQDQGLGHAAARVGAILALMADGSGSNAGWAWPKQSTLAGYIGTSVSTVERALRELHAAGWIEARRTRMGNSYRVIERVDGDWRHVVLGPPVVRPTRPA